MMFLCSIRYLFCLSLTYICLIQFSCLATDEAFYMFDVGQGNSQLAIYGRSGLGVLYDCGSTAFRQHPKIIGLKNKENFEPFYQEIFSKKSEIKFPDFFSSKTKIADIEMLSPTISPLKSIKKFQTSSSLIMSQTIDHKKEQEEATNSIKKIIQSHNLKHLVVFLSHPDKDHINFFPKVIPEDLLITVFLCGDWLGDGGADTAQSDLSENVKEVLLFLSNRSRKITNFELPHYVNFKDEKGEAYWDIKEQIKFFNTYTHKTKFLYDNLKKKSLPDNDPWYFSGDLYTFLDSFNYKIDYFPQGLENILIHTINGRFDDVNSQSPIISMSMNDLKTRFVCTGDANDETFYSPTFYDYSPNKDFLTFLVLPHHGSIENVSSKMLNIFKPDIVGISAGNGQYSHPSYELIQLIQKKLYKQDLFRKRFVSVDSMVNKFLSFSERKKGKIAHIYKDNNRGIPIICTNVLGTIKVSIDTGIVSFNCLFSDIVYLKDNKFFINWNKNVYEYSKNQYENNDEFEDFDDPFDNPEGIPIVRENNTDNFYYKVEENNMVYLYQAVLQDTSIQKTFYKPLYQKQLLFSPEEPKGYESKGFMDKFSTPFEKSGGKQTLIEEQRYSSHQSLKSSGKKYVDKNFSNLFQPIEYSWINDYTNEKILFSVEQIDNDNDCGFKAIGTTREDACNFLLSHANNSDVRSIVASEIRAAIYEGTLPKEMNSPYSFFNQYQIQIASYVQEFNFNKENTLSDMDIYNLYKENFNKKSNDQKEFMSIFSKYKELENNLGYYINNIDTYQKFISVYKNSTLWLTYSPQYSTTILDALSFLSKQKILVLEEDNSTQNTLKCVYNTQFGDNNRIFILHTRNRTHFDRLNIKSIGF